MLFLQPLHHGSYLKDRRCISYTELPKSSDTSLVKGLIIKLMKPWFFLVLKFNYKEITSLVCKANIHFLWLSKSSGHNSANEILNPLGGKGRGQSNFIHTSFSKPRMQIYYKPPSKNLKKDNPWTNSLRNIFIIHPQATALTFNIFLVRREKGKC